MKSIFISTLLLLPIGGIAQMRYYVDQSANGNATGTSWADAFTDLQTALQAATAGDEIWIADGTYKPTSSSDRTISFEPASGVRIYGGFSGNETTINQRNWANSHTILSGDIGTIGDSLDNSFNVIYLFEPDSLTVLDGLIIMEGTATNGGAPGFSKNREFCGGGLYIMGLNGDAYPIIRNCTFTRNTAQNFGGGLMANGGGMGSSIAPKVINCLFLQNKSLNYGGGMARTGGSMAETGIDIRDCEFIENYAVIGGGLMYSDGNGKDTIEVVGCLFEKNHSSNWAGGAEFFPTRFGKTYLRIDSCQFIANTGKNGAALDLFPSSGIYDGWAKVQNIVFKYNEGLFTGSSTVRLTDIGTENTEIIFSGNNITHNNADIIIESNTAYSKFNFVNNISIGNIENTNLQLLVGDYDTIIINRCAFQDISYTHLIAMSIVSRKTSIFHNSYFNKGNTPQSPFIITDNSINTIINNCTFKGKAKCLYQYGSYYSLRTCILSNCIIVDSMPPNFWTTSLGNYQLSNNYFKNTENVNFNPIFVTFTGPTYSGFDPQFVNPDSGDYRLRPCSPLVNAGTNAAVYAGDIDLDGLPRIQGSAVDVGAYELPVLALGAPPNTLGACLNQNSGKAVFDLLNACEPLNYSWTGPGNLTGNALEYLPAGNYQLTISDQKNDTIFTTFSIPVGPGPQTTFTTTPVFCGTTTGGSIKPWVNGYGPFDFHWSNGYTDSMQLQLPFGHYTVTITDQTGCSATAMAHISRVGSLQIDLQTTPISCAGDENGAINIVPLNGAPPFVWNWSNGATVTSISNLEPGNYSGTMTDTLGCVINWMVPLTAPPPLEIFYTTTPASGQIIADGSIDLTPLGGTAPFAAAWSNGLTELSINNLLPGLYSVTITDAHGCERDTAIEVNWVSRTQDLAGTSVKIWPNPVKEWLHVLPSANWEAFTFTLTDSQGRVIKSVTPSNNNGFSVWMADLPAGVYIWHIRGFEQYHSGIIIR